MAKVPCDPAQVIVNHASFRVELAPTDLAGGADTALLPLPAPSLGGSGPSARGGRRPLVWTGRAEPGDEGAGNLLQAVRERGGSEDGVSTQVLPRVTDTAVLRVPSVVAPRGPGPGELGPGAPLYRPVSGRPYDDLGGSHRPDRAPAVHSDYDDGPDDGPHTLSTPRPRGDGRQGFYPHRNLNLGIVLLPLRLLLGFIAVTAGFAKLTDPVYFDGGERGSMVTWLSSLEPWAVAQPLHSWALAHPVGAGLTVAFVQIVVGVLTIAGLWQRLAAVLGASLSLALLVTVAWQSGPAYDAPDIILLAAWSPLIIAGAPVYSLDARIAAEAWRTLGPRVPVRELRRRVLRRGALLAFMLLGVTLLVGSLLGGAVRSTELTPEHRPDDLPRNSQQGVPVPSESATSGDDPDDAPGAGGPTEESEAGDGAEPGEGPADGVPRDPATSDQQPAPEQTVPAESGAGGSGGAGEAEQPAAPGQQQTDDYPQDSGEPAAPPPAEEGADAPPADDPDPADNGGEESSPGPIGGLLG